MTRLKEESAKCMEKCKQKLSGRGASCIKAKCFDDFSVSEHLVAQKLVRNSLTGKRTLSMLRSKDDSTSSRFVVSPTPLKKRCQYGFRVFLGQGIHRDGSARISSGRYEFEGELKFETFVGSCSSKSSAFTPYTEFLLGK